MADALDEVIARLNRGEPMRAGWLIRAQFASGDMRLWGGHGPVQSAGFEWMGAGNRVGLTNLTIEQGFTASRVDIELSGVNAEFQTKAKQAEAEVKGRILSIFLQAFDEDWQPVGDPRALWSGIMDVMRFSGDATSAKITLTCETPFATRTRPRAVYYTHTDQQVEFPGDRGLEFVSTLEDKNVDQPVEKD